MATLADINTKVSNLTGVDTNSYTNANRVIDLNLWYQKIVTMILDAQDDTNWDDGNKTDYPIYTFPLTTNRDYSIPQTYNVLKIRDLSLSYDGVNYYRATPMDITDYGVLGNAPASATTQNSKIDAFFTIQAPGYDYKYGSLFLYPMALPAQITAGATGIVEFFRSPTEFTLSDLNTGTAVPGIDISFHMMLAYGVAYEYAQAKQLPQATMIYGELQKYEERLRVQYSSKQLDRKYQIKSALENYR